MILAIMEILPVVVVVQVFNTIVFIWSRKALLMSNLVLRQPLPHCDFRSLPCPNTPRMGFCGARPSAMHL